MASVSMEREPAARWNAVQRDASFASERYALFHGDAEKVLRGLPNASVDTCLTSPPYWQARDYKHPLQVGLEAEAEDYVQRLVGVFKEVRRVLRDEGTVWLNLGDSYLHGCGTVDGKPPATGWRRNKQLALIPFRVALALQDDGWWLRNVLAWHKPNAMPSSVKDRLTNTWEPVFLLAKSEQYFFDLDAIRVPHSTDDEVERIRAERGTVSGKAKNRPELRRWLNSPRHRSTIDGLKLVVRRPSVPEATDLASYLRASAAAKGMSIHQIADKLGLPFERTRHYFRTDSIGSRLPPPDTWRRLKSLLDLDDRYEEAMKVEVGDNVFRNHPLGRNPGDLAAIPVTGTSGNGHFATMPIGLAERALKATLPAGGVCLDPFMGTGTTGYVACSLGGRFLGIDIHARYLQQFVNRMRGVREPNGHQRPMNKNSEELSLPLMSTSRHSGLV